MAAKHIGELIRLALQIRKRIRLVPRRIAEQKRGAVSLACVDMPVDRFISEIDLPGHIPGELLLHILPMKIRIRLFIIAQVR
ncbi:hypothetical protein D1872_209950 [compost metagenome]